MADPLIPHPAIAPKRPHNSTFVHHVFAIGLISDTASFKGSFSVESKRRLIAFARNAEFPESLEMVLDAIIF